MRVRVRLYLSLCLLVKALWIREDSRVFPEGS
jgi:hypothetical protein